MSTHQYVAICNVALMGLLALAPAVSPWALAVQGAANQGGVQILPPPPNPGGLVPNLTPELPAQQREPRPGLYNAAPYSMIVRVPGPLAAPMPTIIPPQRSFPERSIEPEILLIPREEPSRLR